MAIAYMIRYVVFYWLQLQRSVSAKKTIVYLQQQLGIPVNRIFVEESMAHTKKGARGRADIVVYRDDECTDVLMIIECKAPYINVLG